MNTRARISEDGRTVTVRVPLSFRKRGGRKLVVAPEGGVPWAPLCTRVDNAMVKAIARAFRWRKLLESGVYGTVEEIAAAEKINDSYVSRVLRLTLLAPDIVEAILDGRQPAEMTLAALMRPFPVGWRKQAEALGGPRGPDSALPPRHRHANHCAIRQNGQNCFLKGGRQCAPPRLVTPGTLSAS